jgi:hypothetical protein
LELGPQPPPPQWQWAKSQEHKDMALQQQAARQTEELDEDWALGFRPKWQA